MKTTLGKIHDEEHLVCALRWRRPKLVARLLACAGAGAAAGVVALWVGPEMRVGALGVGVACVLGVGCYLVRLTRLERKLKELEQ